MSRLRFSGSGAMQSAGRNNGIPGCHQYGMSRVTSGDKGPSMMADFTASLHGGARCSSASSFWAKCVASSARWRRRAVAVSTNSLLEGPRTSPAHDAGLRTHQNVRSRGFFNDSSAHDQHRQQTSWANDANSSSKSQKPEPRQETDSNEEETLGSYPFKCVRKGREQHVPVSIAGTKKSEKKTRLPALSQAACTSPVLSPVQKFQKRSPATISTISPMNRTTGTSHDLLNDAFCSKTRSSTSSCNITTTTSTICSWIHGWASKILFLLRASNSNVWLVMMPHDAWNDCDERAQAPRK